MCEYPIRMGVDVMYMYNCIMNYIYAKVNKMIFIVFPCCFVCLFDLILYIPVYNFSGMSGGVFPGLNQY